MFSLVSLFNSISTYVGYLMAKSSMNRRTVGVYLTHIFFVGGDKRNYTFPKHSLKANIIAQVEFELPYFEAICQDINHSSTGNPSQYIYLLYNVWKHGRYPALIRRQPRVITLSVARGGTATPGATKQLLPPGTEIDRYFRFGLVSLWKNSSGTVWTLAGEIMAFKFLCLMACQPSWAIQCQSHPWRRTAVILFNLKLGAGEGSYFSQRCYSLKVNVIAWLKFTMETPPPMKRKIK